MLIINPQALDKAAKRCRDAQKALSAWRTIIEQADWSNLAEVRSVYPSADGVKVKSGAIVTVFNIRGNHYRLLAGLFYQTKQVRIYDLLTHAEYSKDFWKESL